MPEHNVIVSGWRDWPEARKDWIWGHLDETISIPDGHEPVLFHGQCPKGGVDLWAEQWAERRGIRVRRFPADWGRYGKAAGPRRNAEMVAAGASLCIAFPGPGSRGTWDCVQKASEAGVRVELCSWAEVKALVAAGVRPFE